MTFVFSLQESRVREARIQYDCGETCGDWISQGKLDSHIVTLDAR